MRILFSHADPSKETPLPTRATKGSAGFDLAYSGPDATIWPNSVVLLKTNTCVAVPDGHVGLIRDRSSMASKGLITHAGVIDADYRGEILVVVSNAGVAPIKVHKGDRVAQLLVLPVLTETAVAVDSLPPTARGEGGFGSTGR